MQNGINFDCVCSRAVWSLITQFEPLTILLFGQKSHSRVFLRFIEYFCKILFCKRPISNFYLHAYFLITNKCRSLLQNSSKSIKVWVCFNWHAMFISLAIFKSSVLFCLLFQYLDVYPHSSSANDVGKVTKRFSFSILDVSYICSSVKLTLNMEMLLVQPRSFSPKIFLISNFFPHIKILYINIYIYKVHKNIKQH